MTRRRGGRDDRKINLNASAPKSSKSPFTPGPPLKPRRALFVFLSVLFGVWLIVLLTLYFATVYPQRHHAPSGAGARPTDSIDATRPGASGLPSAPR